MSKIANKPLEILSDVKFNIKDNNISIEGPKGKLEFVKSDDIMIELKENIVKVSSKSELTAMSGTTRSLLSNMLTGVSKGWEKKLTLVGVGYRAKADKTKLELVVGYSHPVNFEIPDGITIETPSQTEIVVTGIDKQKVGQVAADIRSVRPPEPYKGKGIKYSDEEIVKKEAKKK
ncbi:MAG: 50S ribosomal protein L6 [Pseudomonadota bacterium]|nr:50S ribosomal protein L6 [Pseudomonadota bacterium]